jgi:hypothetical protein
VHAGRGVAMHEDHRGLAGLLYRHGAVELADLVWTGTVPSRDAFDRLRVELNDAAGAAGAADETPALTTALRACLDTDDQVSRSLRALLRGDPAALPDERPGASAATSAPGNHPATPAPRNHSAAPAPGTRSAAPAPTAPASPAATNQPFAVTAPADRPSAPLPVTAAASSAHEVFAWAAVAVSAAGVAALFLLPLHVTTVGGPIAYAAVVTLLLADRQGLRPGERFRPPGWGWTLLPPAYLFRRGRALGRWPVHGYALVGLGFLLRAGVHLVGIGGDDLVDLRPFETELAERFAAEWGQPASVDCPRRAASVPTTAFTCVVEAADGATRAEYDFRIVDEDGRVELAGTRLTTRATG